MEWYNIKTKLIEKSCEMSKWIIQSKEMLVYKDLCCIYIEYRTLPAAAEHTVDKTFSIVWQAGVQKLSNFHKVSGKGTFYSGEFCKG